jgi:hypothetical protein
MTDPPLALRPGQTDWETEMWAAAFVAYAIDGTPPPVPLLVPPGTEDQLLAAILKLLDAPSGGAR